MHIRRDTKWLQLLISKCPCCDPLQVYVMPRGKGTSAEDIIGYFSITICIKDKNVQSIWAKKNKKISITRNTHKNVPRLLGNFKYI